MTKKPRGRPPGFVMSEASKNLISKSKIGKKCPIEVREKISAGVKRYWSNRLSNNLLKIYGDDKIAAEWIKNNIEKLDGDQVEKKQRKQVKNDRKYVKYKEILVCDLPYNDDGNEFEFVDELTPEDLVIFAQSRNWDYYMPYKLQHLMDLMKGE